MPLPVYPDQHADHAAECWRRFDAAAADGCAGRYQPGIDLIADVRARCGDSVADGVARELRALIRHRRRKAEEAARKAAGRPR